MPHISIGEQNLLIEILSKGVVTLKSQKTFESKKFYDAVSVLKRNGLVTSTDGGGNTAEYRLTLSGEIFALQLRSFER